MKNVLIKNYSDYDLFDIFNYLSGFTLKLNGKINVNKVKGDSPDADTVIYVMNA